MDDLCCLLILKIFVLIRCISYKFKWRCPCSTILLNNKVSFIDMALIMFLCTKATTASNISYATDRSIVLFEPNVNILINSKWRKSVSKSLYNYSALWLNEEQCWVQYGIYYADLFYAPARILMGPQLSCLREVFNLKGKELRW